MTAGRKEAGQSDCLDWKLARRARLGAGYFGICCAGAIGSGRLLTHYGMSHFQPDAPVVTAIVLLALLSVLILSDESADTPDPPE